MYLLNNYFNFYIKVPIFMKQKGKSEIHIQKEVGSSLRG